MERMIEGLLRKFRIARDLGALDDDQLFECLAAYCVLSEFYENDFDPDEDLPDRADLIVTDSPTQLGAYDPPALLANTRAVHLGAVIAGAHPGRTSPNDITLYASVGLAGTEPYLLALLLGL